MNTEENKLRLSFLKKNAWVVIGLVLSIATILSFQGCGGRQKGATYDKSMDQLKYELEQKEKELQRKEQRNPRSNISVDYSYWKNLIGEIVVEGDCINKSEVTTFKDVRIKVNLYSKTNTLLGSEIFVEYQYLKPKRKTHFKKKFMVPKQVKKASLEILDAANI